MVSVSRIIVLVLVISSVPIIATAETFREFIGGVIEIMNLIIPTIIAASLVYYFWHIIQSVINKGSKDAAQNMRDVAGWGLLGLFVMVSIWGILQILQNTFVSGAGRGGSGGGIETSCAPGDLGCGADSL